MAACILAVRVWRACRRRHQTYPSPPIAAEAAIPAIADMDGIIESL